MPKKSRTKFVRTTVETRQNICDDRFTKYMSISDICIKYKIANSTVRDILKRYQEANVVAYRPRGGPRNATILPMHTDYLRNLIDGEDEENIFTLEQLKVRLLSQFPDDFTSFNSIGIDSLRIHFDKHLQITIRRVLPSETFQLIEDQDRQVYCDKLTKDGVKYMSNCVFVGESNFNICMLTGRARSKKGKRSTVLSKVKRSADLPIIGAMSAKKVESLQYAQKEDGMISKSILSDYFIKLIKCLDKEYCNQFVIMDITSFQNSSAIQELFQQSRHTLYFLPAHSLLFNPIDLYFNNLKNYIKRTLQGNCQTISDLIKESQSQVTEDDCKKWIKNSIDNILQYNHNYNG